MDPGPCHHALRILRLLVLLGWSSFAVDPLDGCSVRIGPGERRTIYRQKESLARRWATQWRRYVRQNAWSLIRHPVVTECTDGPRKRSALGLAAKISQHGGVEHDQRRVLGRICRHGRNAVAQVACTTRGGSA